MGDRRTRSLYLGKSLLDDIAGMAGKQRRTISQQVCWLLELALGAPRLPSGKSDGSLDDTKGRVYVYLEGGLDERVLGARSEMGGEELSYSAAVRALVVGGMAVQARALVCSRCNAVQAKGRRLVMEEVGGG